LTTFSNHLGEVIQLEDYFMLTNSSRQIWNRLHTVYCVVFSVSISLSSISLAQGNTSNPRFESAMKQSELEASKGKYKEAAEAMRRAFTISPQPSLLYDIAIMYERGKVWRDSLKYYQKFIDQAPGDSRVPDAINRIRGLQSQLQGQYEEIMISSQPSGAYLYINERANGSVGQTPHRMKLLPGTYKIIAELDGYVPASQTLKLEEGASSQVAISLYSESEVAPIRFLINRSGAQVYIDRRLRGESPMLKPILVRQGVREIRVTKPGYTPWTKKVSVRPQEPMTVDVILKEAGREEFVVKKAPSDSTTPWIVMGTGAALIGGSVFTGLSAQGLYADLETRKDGQKLIAPQDIEVGNRWVMITNILIGLGVTSLTTGGLLWMLEPADEARSALAPSPIPGQSDVWSKVATEAYP
jgi:hypothetical protein